MPSLIPTLIDNFSRLRLLVVGEAMLDRYLWGSITRLCQEAPAPIVEAGRWESLPGGAANTATNLQSLGCSPIFLSVVGDDLEGKILRQTLEERGVSTGMVLTQPGRTTLAKQRVLSGDQLLLRFDQGSTEAIDPPMEQMTIEWLRILFPRCDGVILSDYGYGILTPGIIEAIAQFQVDHPRPLVVDAKDLTRYRDVGVTAAKPNYDQAMELLGFPPLAEGQTRAELMIEQADRLFALTGAETLAVTLDAEGSVILSQTAPPYCIPTRAADPLQTVGAGDTFTAALTAALAGGATISTAADLAATAAAIVVSKDGTATCTREELLAALVSSIVG